MKYCILNFLVLSFILFAAGCGMQDEPKNGEPAQVFITVGLKNRPLKNVKFEITPERLARGKYIVEGASHCFNCHSVRDWDKPGAPPIEAMKGGGSVMFEDKNIRIVAPNITPDEETGAGSWTDDMFARAIREGIGHDGRALFPLMPYSSLRSLTDEDLASVVVFLKSIPPVHNKLPKRKFSIELQKIIVKFPQPINEPVPEINLSDQKQRGKYLVTIGDCVGCHTAWNNELSPGLFGGGDYIKTRRDSAFTANITFDKSGITYDENTFIQVIRTGKGGTLHSIMPWLAIGNYTDEDLKAIYQYLKTIPPVRHYVNNISEPQYCKRCGLTHGGGELNDERKIKTAKVKLNVFKEYEGVYTSEFGDSLSVYINGDTLMAKNEVEEKLFKLIPVSQTEFAAGNLPFNLNFDKDNSGKVADLSFRIIDNVVCKKVK